MYFPPNLAYDDCECRQNQLECVRYGNKCTFLYFNADYPEYVNSEGSEEPMCEQCIRKKRNIDGVLSLAKGHPHLRKLELECKEEY